MARSGRYLARRCAMQALYQWDLTGQDGEDIESKFIKNASLDERHQAYFFILIDSVPKNIESIDAMIHLHIDRKIEGIDLIERAILRLATYELLYEKTLPTNVILDEAIELAKTFSAENSHKYINGVLDKVAKEVRK